MRICDRCDGRNHIENVEVTICDENGSTLTGPHGSGDLCNRCKAELFDLVREFFHPLPKAKAVKS